MVLWGLPAAAQNWANVPVSQLLYNDDALNKSLDDIDAMPPDRLEAFRQMLAGCTHNMSKNELLSAPCDRAAAYFDLVYADTSALHYLLNAYHSASRRWRSLPDSSMDMKELARIGKILGEWTIRVRERQRREDRDGPYKPAKN